MNTLTLDTGTISHTFPGDSDDGFAFVGEIWRLLETPNVRGSDRVLPGVSGVRAFRRRSTVTEYSLPLYIFGDADHVGAVRDGSQAQVVANLAWITSAFFLPSTPDGTVTATLTVGAVTRTGAAHVIGIEVGDAFDGGLSCTMKLSVPAGALT